VQREEVAYPGCARVRTGERHQPSEETLAGGPCWPNDLAATESRVVARLHEFSAGGGETPSGTVLIRPPVS